MPFQGLEADSWPSDAPTGLAEMGEGSHHHSNKAFPSRDPPPSSHAHPLPSIPASLRSWAVVPPAYWPLPVLPVGMPFPPSPPHGSDSHFLFISRPSGLFLPGSAHVYFILSICIYPQHSPLWLVLTSPSSSLPGGPEPSLTPCLSQDLAQCLACSGAGARFFSFSSPDGRARRII